MKITLLFAVLVCLASVAIATTHYGSNTFYATYYLTNAEYGAGAVFLGAVWFNDQGVGSDFRQMRLDYIAQNGSVFMTEIYNYVSQDKYQICGGTCAHTTWTSPPPVFYATVTGTYDYINGSNGNCPIPNYQNYQACVTGCTGLVSDPAQPQGVWQIGFNSSSEMCLVRFTPPLGCEYGPEWQILTYYTSNYPTLSPLLNSTYYNVIAGLTCPQPQCFAKIDLALIIDQSGSIGSAWPLVVNFTETIVQSLVMGTDQAQVGLAFFSGCGDCSHNYTGSSVVSCSPSGDCATCGGLWDLKYQGTSPNKTFVLNCIQKQVYQAGYTCISCGVAVGLEILKTNPRPNTPQIILLFTDGYENRITGRLGYVSGYVRPQVTKILAVGVNQYVYSQLLCITGNASYIYATSSFTQLNSLIQSFIAPLCDPLPNIASCDYCTSICACGTSCICPISCADGNACTNEIPCNPNPSTVTGGTQGKCIYTTVVCNDNNTCTTDTCNTTTGCVYTPVPRPANDPPTDPFCTIYNCTNNVGWQAYDNGPAKCGANNNMCNVSYCSNTINSGAGGCVVLNASSIAYQTTVTYVNSAGVTGYVQGCQKPAGLAPCITYNCNPLTGACTIDTTKCACLNNTDCNDNNGCTNDVCNTTLNACLYTNVDCFNIVSGGLCPLNSATNTQSNATGCAFYNGQTAYTLSANGLPPTGTYSCGELACLNGQKSIYNCKSTGDYSSECIRTGTNCVPSSCSNNICTSTGSWSAGQIATSCGTSVPVTCPDSLLCTTSTCNTTWNPADSTSLRCITTSNSSKCNDNNVCTNDFCSNSTGCYHTTVPAPANNTFCYNYSCNSVSGYSKTDYSSSLCVQSSNLCYINYCNNAISGCSQINKTAFNTSTTVSYVDSTGTTHYVTGCSAPLGALNCSVYACNATTGACYVDTSGCTCTVDSDCNDHNGCTTDVCVNGAKCSYIPTDCYNTLSNGVCTNATVYSSTNTTGCAYYNGQAPISLTNGLPPVSSYTCDQLACLNGQPSSYTCQSTGDYSSKCVRTFSTCTTGGCQDNICGSSGSGTAITASCTTYSYVPNCNPNNLCEIGYCNTSYVTGNPVSQRCYTTSNTSNCDDNNVCTNDFCSTTTGCYHTPVSPPAANSSCYTYTCDPITGYQQNEIGYSGCNEDINNLCDIKFCNTTSGTCTGYNTANIPYGTSTTFTDSRGNTYTIQGCQKPASDPYVCRQYQCNPTTGTCFINISTCVCLSDAACSDGNGCIINTCNPTLNQCQSTNIDCFAMFSNNGCTQNGAYSASTATGVAVWDGTASTNYTTVDAYGNPSPSTGVTRTCDQLGCYNGQPSTYTCLSTSPTTYTCNRTYAVCSMNGCQDNRCETLGTWTAAGQISSDCGNIYIPNCADGNVCHNNFCNSSWTPLDPVANRCLHIPINATQVCDDGNFCTCDYCDPLETSGEICAHYVYGEQYLKDNICTQNISCANVSCILNQCYYTSVVCANPSLCFSYVCNATSNNTCFTITSEVYIVDTCGVCGGNGLSCAQNNNGQPVGGSIATAAAIGGSLGSAFALCAAIAAGRKGYDKYQELANEVNGQVKVSGAYGGAETGGANTGIRKSAFEHE